MPTRRAFTPEDIRRQVVLEEFDLSADGELAVVGRRAVRGDRYVAHLWTIPLAARAGRRGRSSSRAYPLTSGIVQDRQPAISPDGGLVAWIRSWPDDEDRPSAIHLATTRGGRIREVRAGAHGGVDSVAWSPDGSRLAFTAAVDPPRFIIGKRRPLAGRPRRGSVPAEEPSPTARHIARSDWRFDELGHLDHWSHLFVVDVRTGARPRQVTSGDWGVSQIAWHPDGRTVAFACDRGPEPDIRPRTTIWTVDVDAREPEPREVMAPPGWASRPAYSADGRWLAAVGVLEPEPLDDVSPTLLIGPADGSAPPTAIAADLDRPFANWVDADLTGWMVDGRPGPVWLGSEEVMCVVADRGRSHPWWFTIDPSTGEPTGRGRVVEGDIVTHALSVSADGMAAWLGTDSTRAVELSTVAGEGAPVRRRTTMGSAWQRTYPQPSMMLTQAPGDGGPIDVWIASPADAGGRALPTVVDVHGGPLGAWAPAPHIEVSLLVARGYRVVLPNIRGSATYGRDWVRPQLGDWGGVDAADVHAALDHVIGLGLADPDRLGVLGLSYGGFMVNWLVGTTDRFKAAVSENGVTNQVSDWANSDSGPEYDRNALLGDPFTPEGVERLWRQSPLRNVANVRTPLLMLQGEADLRCPPQDNEQFFIALRHLGRTVEYVLYPESYHVYGNSGRPDRRVDRHTRMLDWFDRYLKG